MSYAQFGPDSDVLVYLHTGGYFCCRACTLTPLQWIPDPTSSFGERPDDSPDAGCCTFYSTSAVLAHLDAHRSIGDLVPGQAYSRLQELAERNDAFIAKGMGAAE